MSEDPEILEKRRSLEEILRLLDITRDIDRNQDDGNFARSDGKIHYAFDENVFEMFMEPWRWKGRTATFYAPFWLKRLKPGAEPRSWSSFSAQSALIASEYLFSGNLPGQQKQPICISEWHAVELRHRLEELLHIFLERAARHPRKPTALPVEQLPQLQEDLARIGRSSQGLTAEAIDRFVATRTAAHTLASDQIHEPLEQLQRLISDSLRANIMALHERFKPTPQDNQRIAREADLWLARLVEEEDRRNRHEQEGGRPRPLKRSRGSLRSDADTVAFVQWAAGRCDRSKERVVLVTGDDLLFDAYRGWHCKISPYDPEFIQPFCLRRLAQYAPIFNLNDTDSDVAGTRDLFEQTRAAVEVALLPFNLAQMGAYGDQQSKVNRGREFLALRRVHVVKLEEDMPILAFSSGLNNAWLDQSSRSLNALSTFWQQTERIAIGSNYERLAARLDDDQRREAVQVMGDGANVLRDTLTGYINDLLGSIVANSVRLWYPLAVTFIISAVEQAGRLPETRVRPPIHLHFRHEQTALPDDLGNLFEHLRKGGQARQRQLMAATRDFELQPELLFIVAAILALSLRAWDEAERFAELAKHAGGFTDTYEGRAVPEEASEYLYLHALAKRFRVGSMATSRTAVALHRVRELRQSALVLLDTCLLAIPAMRDPSRSPVATQIRTLSERAALQLFCFVAFRVHAEGAKDRAPPLIEEAAQALEAAKTDLQNCVRLSRETGKLTSSVTGDRAYPIRRQVIANIAATASICAAFALPEAGPEFFDEVIVDEAERLLGTDREMLPDVVQLELAIYVALARGTADARERLQAIVRADPASQGSLPIDGELLHKLKSWATAFLSPGKESES